MRLLNSVLGNDLACLVAKVFETQWDREAINACWPPISDEEFMAACPPETDRLIALKVRRIVAEQLGVDYSRLHPAPRFVEDLGAD